MFTKHPDIPFPRHYATKAQHSPIAPTAVTALSMAVKHNYFIKVK
jgi:hypothetical protein